MTTHSLGGDGGVVAFLFSAIAFKPCQRSALLKWDTVKTIDVCASIFQLLAYRRSFLTAIVAN